MRQGCIYHKGKFISTGTDRSFLKLTAWETINPPSESAVQQGERWQEAPQICQKFHIPEIDNYLFTDTAVGAGSIRSSRGNPLVEIA